MDTYSLAEALRARLREQKLCSDEELAAIADMELIDTYITCSGCGHKSVDLPRLLMTILWAENVEQWLDMTAREHLH